MQEIIDLGLLVLLAYDIYLIGIVAGYMMAEVAYGYR